MLQAAIETEVSEFLSLHEQRRDEQGRRLVVRNGHLPAREILTGAGPLEVRQPRVRDRSPRKEQRVQFSPSVLPPYLRRSRSLDELIPWLYLKGVSTGDFSDALRALLGDNAPGLSANCVVRLKEHWSAEYEQWSRRDLSQTQYVYLWADGIYVNVRLESEENSRQCLLVLMGATAEGQKELIAVRDGYRESEQSWSELLLDLKSRGLTLAPKLAVGDGALGFWAALRKVFPETREQRCWVHKTANVLDKLPKHWIHLRTTNPIESTFASIRLRHRRTKGSGTRRTSLAMMFKLAQSAEKRWRRVNGHQHILHVLEGRTFTDGILQDAA